MYGNLYTDYGMITENIVYRTNTEIKNPVYSEYGDVLIPASDTTPTGLARATSLEKSGVLLGGDINIIRPNEGINGSCLSLALNANRKELIRLIKGTTVRHIHNSEIKDIVICLPKLETEQVRVSSYFKQLDHLITLHQREFAFLCKEKSKKFRYIKNAWEQRKVREVTDRYDNLRIPVAASLRVAGTTPYYGANGIQDYVDGYTHDGEFILVAEDGANDLKNYPVKCVKGRIWVNNHAHVLQGKYDCADNQFLAYAISQADIESLLVGGGRAKLNAETLMGIDLLLPNKAEQIRIGKYLAQLDNLITLHQRKPNFYTGGYYAE